MLVIYDLVLPLALCQSVSQHEQAAKHYDKDAPDHDLVHENNDERVDDSPEQEHQRVHNGDVPLMVSLQTIVKRSVLVRWLYRLLQLKSVSRLFVRDITLRLKLKTDRVVSPLTTTLHVMAYSLILVQKVVI